MLSLVLLFASTLTQISELASAVDANTPDRCAEFCVTGTVSYTVIFKEHNCHILLEDASAAVDIAGMFEDSLPNPGDIIKINGAIVPLVVGKNIQPQFTAIEILGHTNAPVAITAPASKIMNGSCDFRRAKLIGEVRDVEPSGTNPNWHYLSIISEGNQYYAPIPTRGATLPELETLIGSTVCLDGFPDSHNCSYRFLDERRFMVADRTHITVLSPPADDPFARAPPVSVLHRLPAEKISRLGRHRASGHILTVWQARQALLQLDDARKVYVSFSKPTDLRRGQSVEVIGYPSTDGFMLRLSRSIARPVPGKLLPVPSVEKISEAEFKVQLTDASWSKTQLQGHRVQICGTVAEFHRRPDESGSFQLLITGRLLDVDCSAAGKRVANLEAGCRIRVTGTCVLETENWSVISDGLQLNGIRLVTDRPEDLEILARPPWWTPARLALAIFVLLVALAVFALWNLTLRRLSEKRGRELFLERSANAMAELKTEERTRLAVELHDSISQILTGAAMQLDAGETNAAKRILASCRRELRSCLWDLRSNAIDATDFADAVRETVAPHLGGRKLVVDMNIPSDALSEELRHAALRIIREATANAVRHGRATLVSISGEIDGQRLSFAVVDDGRGFDPSVTQGSATGHFGLLGMRERAKAFNGTVNIVSSPGSGTEVTVVLEDRAGYDFGEDFTDRNAAST